MRIRNHGARIWVTLSLASLACTTTKMVPAADSHSGTRAAAGFGECHSSCLRRRDCHPMLRGRSLVSAAHPDMENG